MKKALLITLAVVILLASLVGDYYIIKAVARRLQPAPAEVTSGTLPERIVHSEKAALKGGFCMEQITVRCRGSALRRP